MFGMDEKTLAALREYYPKGARVKLIGTNDIQAPPLGTEGTVLGVDDIGSVMVRWDNGSSLSVTYGEDTCLRLSVPERNTMDKEIWAFVITYSFGTKCVAVGWFDSQEEADKVRKKWIEEEITLVRTEQGYTPYLDDVDPYDNILWYEEKDGLPNAESPDYAEYRLIPLRKYETESKDDKKENEKCIV